MVEYREFRWKIEAYSPETMPLDRLLEYLRELSILLGEGANLHLVRVESASTAPVFKVPPDVAPRLQARALAVRTGSAPREARQSYRKINKMLRDDHTKAVLLEETVTLIPFPGIDEAPPRQIAGIQQPGSVDGRLVSIGGVRDWVPLQLQTPEKLLTGVYARRSLAKEISAHLFDPVRLLGQGRWCRTEEGEWNLEHFTVNAFDPLNDQELPSVVAALRSVRVRWPEDPIAALGAMRNGDDGLD